MLDGELVAFNDDSDPHFPLLYQRILNDDGAIRITLMIFDVLAIEGETLLSQPYSVRRQRLEELALDGHSWKTPASFDDGVALFDAVCERGLEGVVAKPHRSTYQPAKRSWVKVKNPDNWRRESELHAMQCWARATADS